MRRVTAAVMLMMTALTMVSCGTIKRPAEHTATIAHERRVLLALDGDDRDQVMLCSNACKDFSCTASCPTATTGEGACGPEKSAARLCRSFVEPRSLGRQPGTCAETNSRDVRRISCDDFPAQYKHGHPGLIILTSTVLVLAALVVYGVTHRE